MKQVKIDSPTNYKDTNTHHRQVGLQGKIQFAPNQISPLRPGTKWPVIEGPKLFFDEWLKVLNLTRKSNILNW